MGSLYFAIGTARAGKSTYAKRWIEEGFDLREYRVVVNADSIRLAMGHRYNDYTEGLVGAIKRLEILAHLEYGASVYVDGTHTTLNSIKDIYRIRQDAIPVLIDAAPEVAIQRAHETGQSDLENIIKRQYNNLVEMWRRYKPHLTFSLSDKTSWTEIFNKIRDETQPWEPRIV
jgi:hypothetical protein